MTPQEFAQDLKNLLPTAIAHSDVLLARPGGNPMDSGDLEDILHAGREAAALSQRLLNSQRGHRIMTANIPAVWHYFEDCASTSPRPAPPAVLVVDDETSIRAYVSRVLQTAGYEVVIAGSAAEALDRFKDMKRCDLVLTDLLMPDVNGDELARRLRLEQPDLKVLYLTGFSERLFADKMTLWDGEAFLDKPCSPKAMVEGVSLLLTGHVDSAVATLG